MTDPRYVRQAGLAELGEQGQRRLGESGVLVVGCGALGSTLAELLVRAGVGRVRVVDRDIVELTNLHRQLLYDEADVARGAAKAEAAGARLRQINSAVEVDARVVDVTPISILPLVEEIDLVLDGTDNVETRYLINDVCLDREIPWVYGGAVGTNGMVMAIRPGQGPCLRCLFPEPPPPGTLPTCDTRGILNTVPVLVASLQVTEGIKILTQSPDVNDDLLVVDPWRGSFQSVKVGRAEDCPACVRGERDFLDGFELTEVTPLCGRGAVQIEPSQPLGASLAELEARLCEVGEVDYDGQRLRLRVDALELILFPDARAIINGTTDPVVARSFYAKVVGA